MCRALLAGGLGCVTVTYIKYYSMSVLTDIEYYSMFIEYYSMCCGCDTAQAEAMFVNKFQGDEWSQVIDMNIQLCTTGIQQI